MTTPTVVADQGSTPTTSTGRLQKFTRVSVIAVLALIVLFVLLNPPAFLSNRGVETAPPELQGTTDQPAMIPPTSGATRLVNGVPVGYTHDQAGAVAAATNYLTTLYGDVRILGPDSARMVGTLAAPDVADKLRADLAPAITATRTALALDESGQPTPGDQVAYRMNPITYSIEASAPDSATISVWWMGLVGIAAEDSPFPVQVVFGTDQIKLAWIADDWKLTATKHSEGPAPVTGTDPSKADEMRKALDAFPYGYGR